MKPRAARASASRARLGRGQGSSATRAMPLEVALDGPHDVLGADRGEDVEGVLGAGELGVGHAVLRGLAERGDEQPGLLDRDQGVAVAVQHEEVGGVRR